MPTVAEDAELFTFLLTLVDRLEPRVRNRFRRDINRARLRIDLGKVETAARTGRVAPVLAAVDVDDISASTAAGAIAAGRAILDTAGPRLIAHASRTTGLELSWDLVRNGVSRELALHAADLVTSISETTRVALRRAIVQSFEADLLASQTAEVVGQVAGLDPRQSTALARYRAELIRRELPVSRIESLTETYRSRLVLSRGTRIARTELMRAGNRTQRLIWSQASHQHREMEEEWVRENVAVIRDGKVCEYCWTRHGWRAPIRGVYQDGWQGPPWPHGSGISTVNCRCTERLSRPTDEELSRPAFVEPAGGGSLRPAA